MPITARSGRTADSCEAAPKSIYRGDRSVFLWAGRGRLRAALVALGALALTLALGAATAQASLFSQVSAFGATEFVSPDGVAVQQSSGNVYVADSGNARVDKFGPGGNFIAAFGWGVADGKAQAEVCTSSCQAGIPGSGPGQLSNPAFVAVGGPGSASAGKVYVGDFSNGRVEKFDADGNFISSNDGSTTPQGKYQSLSAVAVDQNGNLWTTDFNTSNVDEFDAHGNFLQQWNDGAVNGFGTGGIVVDASNNAVYLAGNTELQRFTLNGKPGPVIEHAGLAGDSVALDPQTHDVYLDVEGHVDVFDPTGFHLDTVPNTGPGGNGAWVAFGHNHLYVSGPGLHQVNVFGVPPAGPPLITSEVGTETTLTAATLGAAIVPLGHDTTCAFQFVDDAGFQASGYNNATTVPCTPTDLGSSFTYQHVSASESALEVGVTYHFRVVATSAAGTTTGADTTFTMVDDWAPFNRCPVDDPAMLATTGVSHGFNGSGTGSICLASNSPHGSITIGKITTATGNTNLQAGLVIDTSTLTFSVIAPAGGALVADPVQLSTPVGPVTAVTESAGAPSNFSLLGGISVDVPIITVPIKIHLENPVLGPDCFLGSDQNPIDLNPENTDVSNLTGKLENFDPSGVPDPNSPLNTIATTGAVQGDDTFAVPGATGCGPNGNGSLDAAVDAVAGVPSPSGSNHLVLDDAASALALSFQLLGLPVPGQGGLTGQQFAADWHVHFG